MKNKLIKLKEEVSYKSDIVHHTNLKALDGILERGLILPSAYYVNSKKTKKGDEDLREIAVLRRSVDRYIKNIGKKDRESWESKMLSLTEEARGVKIYLFSDNILSSVRGVKRKPISEYGRESMVTLNNSMKLLFEYCTIYNKDLDFKHFKKAVVSSGNNLRKKYEGIPIDKIVDIRWNKLRDEHAEEAKVFAEQAELIRSKLDLKFKDKTDMQNLDKSFFKILFDYLSFYKTADQHREGEERMIFGKNSRGIPLDKKFLKIRIIDYINIRYLENEYEKRVKGETEVTYEYIGYLIKVMERFKENLIKYENCFIVDRYYRRLIKSVGDYLGELKYVYNRKED